MIEVIVIAILALLLGWKEYLSRKEREDFLDALMSKNAQDLVDIKIAKKFKPKEESPLPPDLVPIEEVEEEDKDFQKAIKNEGI